MARDFYSRVFDAEPVFEEGDSVVFRTGSTLINLLRIAAADELVRPAVVGSADVGVRAVYTIEVADVDAVVAELRERSVELLNGPMDRWWGPRTASFQDLLRPCLGDRRTTAHRGGGRQGLSPHCPSHPGPSPASQPAPGSAPGLRLGPPPSRRLCPRLHLCLSPALQPVPELEPPHCQGVCLGVVPGVNGTCRHAAISSASQSCRCSSGGTCSKPWSVNGVPSQRSAGVCQPMAPLSRW